MDRLHLMGLGVFVLALAVAGDAAGAPRGWQLAARTNVAIDDEVSSGGGDWIPLESFGDKGARSRSPASYDALLDEQVVFSSAAADAPRPAAPRKKLKHKACVHGGWTSTVEFNPFTLACAEVGF